MRPKSRTTHDAPQRKLQAVDYTECLFNCVLHRRKFIGKGPRYLYFFKHQICIAKSPQAAIPERQFQINQDTRLQWSYTKKKLRSVTFLVGTDSFEYFGSPETLRELKNRCGLYIFQIKIQDEYRADSVLGKGSYATVLELTNLCDQKQYASKCIDQQRLNEKKNGFRQLLQEIEAMRTLAEGNHPNILRLQELYIGNQNYYLVMELARGGSLLSMMKKQQTLFDRSDIRHVMRQLLEGLEFIHSHNIMHRDLKPENILFLDKSLDSLKIADFGLAQSTYSHPYTYPKCGTPGFVAPEILEQDSDLASYTELCDIFSAGVIFYVLMVGEPLFERKDRREQLELNRKCEINLERFTSEMLDPLEKDLLSKMLAKNPEHRWSASSLLKHRYFVQDQIESESDYLRLNNMAILKKSRMPDFSKNPFMQQNREKALTTVRAKNISLVMQTNLNLNKSSQDYIIEHGQFQGSFNLINNEVVK